MDTLDLQDTAVILRICKDVITRSTFPLVQILLFATILQVYQHRAPLIRFFDARSAADSVSCG